MKRKIWIIGILAIVAIFVVGCESIFGSKNANNDNFKAVVEDNIIHLTCKNAAKDSTASANILLEEDEELVIHTNLEKLEKVNIKVYPVDHDDSDEALVDLDGYGVNPYSYPLEPGEYVVYFKALDTTNGSVDISAE